MTTDLASSLALLFMRAAIPVHHKILNKLKNSPMIMKTSPHGTSKQQQQVVLFSGTCSAFSTTYGPLSAGGMAPPGIAMLSTPAPP